MPHRVYVILEVLVDVVHVAFLYVEPPTVSIPLERELVCGCEDGLRNGWLVEPHVKRFAVGVIARENPIGMCALRRV